VQAIFLPITDRVRDRCLELSALGRVMGLRCEVDLRSEKVNAKIRDAQVAKIPYMLVVGDREAADGTVSVRHRKHGDRGAVPADAFFAALLEEVRQRLP
jgi:threonyl-tRNA synthetase